MELAIRSILQPISVSLSSFSLDKDMISQLQKLVLLQLLANFILLIHSPIMRLLETISSILKIFASIFKIIKLSSQVIKISHIVFELPIIIFYLGVRFA
jgi:hypothetical protein